MSADFVTPTRHATTTTTTKTTTSALMVPASYLFIEEYGPQFHCMQTTVCRPCLRESSFGGRLSLNPQCHPSLLFLLIHGCRTATLFVSAQSWVKPVPFGALSTYFRVDHSRYERTELQRLDHSCTVATARGRDERSIVSCGELVKAGANGVEYKQ